jgi:hypothetical protein
LQKRSAIPGANDCNKTFASDCGIAAHPKRESRPVGQRREAFFNRNLRGLESSASDDTSAPTARAPQIAYFAERKSFTALPFRANEFLWEPISSCSGLSGRAIRLKGGNMPARGNAPGRAPKSNPAALKGRNQRA